ncbi:tRNA pseudouridine synthase-like 1 [Scleropages formosus]|uniref:tRNA pseudouridine synthase n=1 Tax=Scleropages formosus TaxID=113540 RepID=A0A8C9V0T5_SCLFO|nr:tRNA pseudouridine synthase-like 1 [Scleropages formosus]XP_018606854.2 tRNA pseudouridine synthase-like 1 [Scleropages formosus]
MRSPRVRYLLLFQYLGTNYCGVMKSPAQQPGTGVQNHLENAVRKLRPVNEVSLSISSRTDTGVHALCNSAHVDIERKADKPPFSEQILTKALNFHLQTESIRVIRALRVPDTFHARFHAISRTYVYRLATGVGHHSELPLPEKNFCWPLQETGLDVRAMEEASTLLLGTHDFSSFRALNSETPFKNPVKTLLCAHVGLRQGSFSQEHFHRDLQYWEFTFKSRSFLYKQVRRMTGALVAVGRRKLSVSQLREILEARDSLAYPHNMTAPPDGLFLTNVEYTESDLLPLVQEWDMKS